MQTLLKAAGVSLIASSVIAAIAFPAPAHAASSRQWTYTHSACEGADAICGVIVMANGGSFTLESVELKAKDNQPNGASAAKHPSCEGFSKKMKDNVASANYGVFVVPASCAYKLKISIQAANKKDQDLYLTPGCQIQNQVSGSAASNNWKSPKITVLDDAQGKVPVNAKGYPMDRAGYTCGKLSKAAP